MTESPVNLDDLKDKVSTITGEKAWSMSCYVPVFNIVTCVLTAVKIVNSKMCLFHARQGLVLFALWFLTIVAALFSPILSLMLWGVVLTLHAAGMVIAFNMKETRIPIIGQLANKIPDNYIYSFLTRKISDKPAANVQAEGTVADEVAQAGKEAVKPVEQNAAPKPMENSK